MYVCMYVWAKKLYSEAVHTSTDKRFKLLVKSKINLSTEAIKTVVRTNINPTAMKVGVVLQVTEGR